MKNGTWCILYRYMKSMQNQVQVWISKYSLLETIPNSAPDGLSRKDGKRLYATGSHWRSIHYTALSNIGAHSLLINVSLNCRVIRCDSQLCC